MEEEYTNNNLEKARKQHKKQYDWLKPYQFKKGESGNPAGKKPGKSLKVWVREYFEQLPDEEKIKFLNLIDPELVWRMGEGNPQSNTDITSGGKPLINDQTRNKIRKVFEDTRGGEETRD